MEPCLYDAVSWLFMGTTHTAPESETSREYLSKHTHPPSLACPPHFPTRFAGVEWAERRLRPAVRCRAAAWACRTRFGSPGRGPARSRGPARGCQALPVPAVTRWRLPGPADRLVCGPWPPYKDRPAESGAGRAAGVQEAGARARLGYGGCGPAPGPSASGPPARSVPRLQVGTGPTSARGWPGPSPGPA